MPESSRGWTAPAGHDDQTHANTASHGTRAYLDARVSTPMHEREQVGWMIIEDKGGRGSKQVRRTPTPMHEMGPQRTRLDVGRSAEAGYRR